VDLTKKIELGFKMKRNILKKVPCWIIIMTGPLILSRDTARGEEPAHDVKMRIYLGLLSNLTPNSQGC
jgi:ribosomal protein L39E